MSATLTELTNTDEIGDKIAQSIVDYFANDENRLFINRLIGYGLQFEQAKTETASQKLAGLTIIASGKLEHFSRDEINRTIELHGGKPVTSVSSKTNYLIAGENIGPNKLAKARELGVPIISEAEFMAMIADTNNELSTDVSTTTNSDELVIEETENQAKTDDNNEKPNNPIQMSLF